MNPTPIEERGGYAHSARFMASGNQVVYLSPCPLCGEKFWCKTEQGNIIHVQGNDMITNSSSQTEDTPSRPVTPIEPQPKSVDELDSIIKLYDEWLAHDEWHYGKTDPNRHPDNGHEDFDDDKFKAALLAWNEASNKAAVVEVLEQLLEVIPSRGVLKLYIREKIKYLSSLTQQDGKDEG